MPPVPTVYRTVDAEKQASLCPAETAPVKLEPYSQPEARKEYTRRGLIVSIHSGVIRIRRHIFLHHPMRGSDDESAEKKKSIAWLSPTSFDAE